MIGLTPAIIHLATTRSFDGKEFTYDMAGTILYAAMGFTISLAIYIVALITRWKHLSEVINWLYTGISICYICYMVSFWISPNSDSSITPETTEVPLATPETNK